MDVGVADRAEILTDTIEQRHHIRRASSIEIDPVVTAEIESRLDAARGPIASFFAVPLGVVAATRPGSLWDGAAQTVALTGQAGIGKSRLVFELFNAIEAGDELVYWRRGRSLPYGDGVTFWALGEMVKAQAGILENDPRDEVERKLREAAGDRWVERHLRPLVGLGADTDERTSEEARTAWRRFFESLAERRPLVLEFLQSVGIAPKP